MSQAAAEECARLRWQCRRGMRELDDLFMGFMNKRYDSLNAHEIASFKDLLSYPDQLLLEYMMGRIQPTDRSLQQIVEKIRAATAD